MERVGGGGDGGVFVRESTPETDIPSRDLFECLRCGGRKELLVQQRCLSGRSVASPLNVKLREEGEKNSSLSVRHIQCDHNRVYTVGSSLGSCCHGEVSRSL